MAAAIQAAKWTIRASFLVDYKNSSQQVDIGPKDNLVFGMGCFLNGSLGRMFW